MTQPQTLPMVDIAFSMARGRDTLRAGVEAPAVFSGSFVSTAQSSALAIWMPHSTQGAYHCVNIGPTMPNRKDGPALLQKDKSLLASVLVMRPS